MSDKIPTYMSESIKRSKRAMNEQKVLGHRSLIIKNDFINDLDIDAVFDIIKKSVPEKFYHNVDAFYVGEFEEMLEREVNALYQDGVIYLSNIQDDVDDMVDDIIHEIAHAVEEDRGMDIYSDGKIEREFLAKRRALHHRLKSKDIDTSGYDFYNPEFDMEFDEFLYQDVGYPLLRSLTPDLFYSPYGATALREYFADTFEAYFHRRKFNLVRNQSPAIFDKIEMFLEEE